MNDMDISNFKDMWTTKLNNYYFIRLQSSTVEEYVIYHIPSKTLIVIEDNEIYLAVEKKMLEAGVRIVNSISEV